MRIEYSKMALKVMVERNIQPAEIEYCLSNYSIAYSNKNGNRVIHKANIQGRTIKVIIVANRYPLLVTTVSDS